MRELTIIAYHYVRAIEKSNFPNIKGLEFNAFKRQLAYLTNNYKIVSAESVINFVLGGAGLPEGACLLTFDDGYKDHIKFVLPELQRLHIQGAFFPPVKAIVDRELLDVNCIHFIIACCSDYKKLYYELNDLCRQEGVTDEELMSYRQKYYVVGMFDVPEIMYFKRMLQHALPQQIKSKILEYLFANYVGADRREFADDLYLSVEEVKYLVDSGMYVGSHGYSHIHFDKENGQIQEMEIKRSLHFLNAIGSEIKNWIMCYPYGQYNDETVRILKENNCTMGLTVNRGIADMAPGNLFKLPRMDTNDFPQ